MAITFKNGDIMKIYYVSYTETGPSTIVLRLQVEKYENGLLMDTEGRVFNIRSAAFVKVEPAK